jgi:hypothetical protein
MRDVTKRRVIALGGEFLRELALLILVFYPLDVYVQYQTLTVEEAAATLVAAGMLWTIGVTLDVRGADD